MQNITNIEKHQLFSYNGKQYRVLHIARCADNEKVVVVVYEQLYSSSLLSTGEALPRGSVWTRPLDDFQKKFIRLACTCLPCDTWVSTCCVICQVPKVSVATDYERSKDCDNHRVIMMCGTPDYVCRSCGDKGWYSTKGTGGGSSLINHITNERRTHPDELIVMQEEDKF